MNWNQPLCAECWHKLNPDRSPARIRPEYADLEQCSNCGIEHRSGIYYRAHANEVNFPAKEKEET